MPEDGNSERLIRDLAEQLRDAVECIDQVREYLEIGTVGRAKWQLMRQADAICSLLRRLKLD